MLPGLSPSPGWEGGSPTRCHRSEHRPGMEPTCRPSAPAPHPGWVLWPDPAAWAAREPVRDPREELHCFRKGALIKMISGKLSEKGKMQDRLCSKQPSVTLKADAHV